MNSRRLPSLYPALLLFSLFACSAAWADPAPPRCLYVEVASLPVSFSGPSLQPSVQGKIDDTPATMLLDTGAHATYLTRTGTDKRDLTLRPSNGAGTYGIGGRSALYGVRLRQFSVGPATRASTTLAVINDMGFTPSYDGIVGADFLMQTDLELDMAGKTVKFYRARDCGKTYLGYWKEESFEVPLLNQYRSRASPQLEVAVNGVKLVAMLDTGASGSSISLAAAKRAGVSPTSPGVTKVGVAMGIGSARVARWRARFATFQVGGETVKEAAIDILDTQHYSGDADVLLGMDFLRAHRVLIANSQDKVYLAYLGGSVFGAPEGISPWIVQEAEGGNPDAQLHLAHRYALGHGVERDGAKAATWRAKAVAQHHVGAVLEQARLLRGASKASDAIAMLKAAIGQHPATPSLAFELFLAQTQAGERDTARRELAAVGIKQWPQPVAAYFLGKIDATALMTEARADNSQAQARACQAGYYQAELHRVLGDPARARQVQDSVLADCRRTPD